MKMLDVDDVISLLQDFGYSVMKHGKGYCTSAPAQPKWLPLLMLPNDYGAALWVCGSVEQALKTHEKGVLQYASAFNAESHVAKVFVRENILHFEACVPWHATPESARSILKRFFEDIPAARGGLCDASLASMFRLERSLVAEGKKLGKRTGRAPRVHCKCDWCGASIKFGNAHFHVDRVIGQIDWEPKHPDGMETVVDADTLVTLCGACGNSFALEQLRDSLQRRDVHVE